MDQQMPAEQSPASIITIMHVSDYWPCNTTPSTVTAQAASSGTERGARSPFATYASTARCPAKHMQLRHDEFIER